MTTAEMEVKTVVDDVDGVLEDNSEDDYEYVYPPELVEEWLKGFEEMELQVARGELKPKTVREAAAECGVILD
jgi:hypothetical protein